MMAYCLNWRDCEVCDSDMRSSHLVGCEVRAEDDFYERRWEHDELRKNADENPTETEESAHVDANTSEQGRTFLRFFCLIVRPHQLIETSSL